MYHNPLELRDGLRLLSRTKHIQVEASISATTRPCQLANSPLLGTVPRLLRSIVLSIGLATTRAEWGHNIKMRFCAMFGLGILMASTLPAGDGGSGGTIEHWRQERETRLKADDGWLTVAGLFWLKDGLNSAGSAEGSSIQLPRAAQHVGDFDFSGGKTTFHADPAVAVLINSKPAKTAALRSDTDEGGPVHGRNRGSNDVCDPPRSTLRHPAKDKDSEYRRFLHWDCIGIRCVKTIGSWRDGCLTTRRIRSPCRTF